jgi:hypothetical protein
MPKVSSTFSANVQFIGSDRAGMIRISSQNTGRSKIGPDARADLKLLNVPSANGVYVLII